MRTILILFTILAAIVGAMYLLCWAVSATIGFVLQGRDSVNKWQSHGKFAVVAGFPLWIICTIYFSLHPSDDFYLQRLSLVALRDAPKSAQVVAKDPSDFGLHSGESCAYSRIVMSQQDYSFLYESITTDARFEEVSLNRQNLPYIKSDLIKKTDFMRSDQEQPFNGTYELSFFSDGRHIDVYSCI